MNVLFLPEVEEYLFELIRILHEKEYFGFYDDAIDYVEELIEDIEQNLSLDVLRNAPLYFQKEGREIYYSILNRNKNTTWFIFFTIYEGNMLLVENIINNHVPEAQYFN